MEGLIGMRDGHGTGTMDCAASGMEMPRPPALRSARPGVAVVPPLPSVVLETAN